MEANQNASGGRNMQFDGMITNAIECISRLREMQTVVTNPGVIANNNNAEQPSLASEIVRLFPTFASSRSGHEQAQPASTSTRSSENAGNRNSPSSCQRSSRQSSEARRGATANQRRPANNSSRPTTRSSSNNKKKRTKLVHKDIIFIFDPTVTKVPTHKTRLRLESKGRVIHDFAFDRDWEEYRLRSAIEEELPMLMNVEYEFLKVIRPYKRWTIKYV